MNPFIEDILNRIQDLLELSPPVSIYPQVTGYPQMPVRLPVPLAISATAFVSFSFFSWGSATYARVISLFSYQNSVKIQ